MIITSGWIHNRSAPIFRSGRRAAIRSTLITRARNVPWQGRFTEVQLGA